MQESALFHVTLVSLGTFAATVMLVHFYRKLALRYNFIDIPDDRKRHERGTAPIGGLAIFTAFYLCLPWLGTGALNNFHGLYAGILILLITGAIDDKIHLSARTKLAMQALAGVCMVSWEGVSVTYLGDLFGFGVIELHDFAIPFSLFCLIALINAVNMSDGIDGLAGGITVTSLFWLAVCAWQAGHETHLSQILPLIGATCGFLLFNFRNWWRRSALVFLGDAGSLALGFTLGWFATDLAHQTPSAFPPVTAVWILGLPIMDMTSLVVRRLRKGQSPFAADRSHLHHMFIRAGFSVRRTAVILVLTSGILGGIGVAGAYTQVPDPVMFYGFLAMLVAYNLLSLRPVLLMRRLRKMTPERCNRDKRGTTL